VANNRMLDFLNTISLKEDALQLSLEKNLSTVASQMELHEQNSKGGNQQLTQKIQVGRFHFC
jgi:hypothetical protein